MIASRLATVLLVASVPLLAQDAISTLPGHYTLQFENDWVKVTRVHYPPHAKLPGHAHTTLASAYVYLNDSGPVIFRHVGGENGAITRAPTKAGSFRVFRAVPDEIHEVENTSGLPSDFLRVEFKTDPGSDRRSLRGKFLPEPTFDEPMQKVQFENAQVRVTRLFWPPASTIEIASAPHPSLLISLSPGTIGTVRWLPGGTADRIENASQTAMEMLRFELKTAPGSQP
jgi:hypothetical protein